MHSFDHYQILSKLGQGAMGVVYKATDTRLDRPVALKVMSINLEPTLREQFAARLQQEARSAGRLNHPNIITIYECERVNDLPYIAMEFVDGPSLADMQETGKQLPIDKVLKILRQLLKGLSYAHQNSIVHRDIKPGNLMFTSTGVLKITDFGIAQMPASDLTQTDTPLGSPRYMSPEQVSAKRVDGRSDIFSCGVLLYEMLTGKAPFDADNVASVVYKILFEMPPAPIELNPAVPKWLSDLTMICLAKAPEQRFQSAEAMLDAVRGGLRERDEELVAHGTLIPKPEAVVAAKHPAPAAAGTKKKHAVGKPLAIWGGVLVAVGLLAVGVGVWLSTRLQPVTSPSQAPVVATQPTTLDPQANWKNAGAATLVTPPKVEPPAAVSLSESDEVVTQPDANAANSATASQPVPAGAAVVPLRTEKGGDSRGRKPTKDVKPDKPETPEPVRQPQIVREREPEPSPPAPKPAEQHRPRNNDNKSFWGKQLDCVRDGKCEAPVEQRTKRDR
ncbi:serine/threonine-protein kinase [Chitinivorax tropicus]|uniref:non-specific serine/threonine protein kinase n=1 Tax=Chitinivorax tropicus TaxID=714531 RepID=A0A840MPS0_9PROT|nr:serine/threonine-protein kinase [Chitinivorax tropicus]MBB5019089.1 serine/threonine-protein kinase [Chitinivorax tropicus]